MEPLYIIHNNKLLKVIEIVDNRFVTEQYPFIGIRPDLCKVLTTKIC